MLTAGFPLAAPVKVQPLLLKLTDEPLILPSAIALSVLLPLHVPELVMVPEKLDPFCAKVTLTPDEHDVGKTRQFPATLTGSASVLLLQAASSRATERNAPLAAAP